MKGLFRGRQVSTTACSTSDTGGRAVHPPYYALDSLRATTVGSIYLLCSATTAGNSMSTPAVGRRPRSAAHDATAIMRPCGHAAMRPGNQ